MVKGIFIEEINCLIECYINLDDLVVYFIILLNGYDLIIVLKLLLGFIVG